MPVRACPQPCRRVRTQTGRFAAAVGLTADVAGSSLADLNIQLGTVPVPGAGQGALLSPGATEGASPLEPLGVDLGQTSHAVGFVNLLCGLYLLSYPAR
jgi:hypothetical protein